MNDREPQEIIVQKFGGSSLANLEGLNKAVDKIVGALERNYLPVVVVSAMGRLGSPFATDTLLNSIEKISPQLAPREKDLLMSCGETISTVFVATVLEAEGFKALAMTGGQAGIKTDNNFGKAKILNIDPERIHKVLKEGYIPVVAGFQGVNSEGDTTTLGRGGSDITATELAVALKASFVEIYTDVDGVMTADPRLVPTAKAIPEITFNEMLELAEQGAKVIHPKAAEVASINNIPVKIISTFKDTSGTTIKGNFKYVEGSDKLVTGITSKRGLSFVNLPFTHIKDFKGASILKYIDENGIKVDFINVQPASLSFLIEQDNVESLKGILVEEDLLHQYSEECCKLTIIGTGIGVTDGIFGNVLEALKEEGIEVYQARDSLTSISCLLREVDEERALNTLHKKFMLEGLVV